MFKFNFTPARPSIADATQHTYSNESSDPAITPITFDKFLPWFCMTWDKCEVKVTRYLRGPKDEDVLVRQQSTKKANQVHSHMKFFELEGTKSRLILEEASIKTSSEIRSELVTTKIESGSQDFLSSDVVKLKTYYDKQNQLLQVDIKRSNIDIPVKVIRAIALCLPFHSKLTRLVVSAGLTSLLICEIGKLLAHSNITEISLDGSDLHDANYDTLLQETCHLSYLSLKRCSIDDEMCEKIAIKLSEGNPASKYLHVLELSSNLITNIGAACLSEMLRWNRCLLHLNLADNQIDDDGAIGLLTPLMEHPLTDKEKNQHRRRRLEFFKKKLASKEELQMDFGEDIILKDGKGYHNKGNIRLCSLNLAYNSCSFPTLKKLEEVLAYQGGATKMEGTTGLMRVVLHGNYLPPDCDELQRIQLHFTNVTKERLPRKMDKSTSAKSVKLAHKKKNVSQHHRRNTSVSVKN